MTVLPTLVPSVTENIADDVPTLNVVVGVFVPSSAVTLLNSAGDAGTLSVAVNPPVELDVTVAGVDGIVTPLNLNVIACDGTTLVPVTVND